MLLYWSCFVLIVSLASAQVYPSAEDVDFEDVNEHGSGETDVKCHSQLNEGTESARTTVFKLLEKNQNEKVHNKPNVFDLLKLFSLATNNNDEEKDHLKTVLIVKELPNALSANLFDNVGKKARRKRDTSSDLNDNDVNVVNNKNPGTGSESNDQEQSEGDSNDPSNNIENSPRQNVNSGVDFETFTLKPSENEDVLAKTNQEVNVEVNNFQDNNAVDNNDSPANDTAAASVNLEENSIDESVDSSSRPVEVNNEVSESNLLNSEVGSSPAYVTSSDDSSVTDTSPSENTVNVVSVISEDLENASANKNDLSTENTVNAQSSDANDTNNFGNPRRSNSFGDDNNDSVNSQNVNNNVEAEPLNIPNPNKNNHKEHHNDSDGTNTDSQKDPLKPDSPLSSKQLHKVQKVLKQNFSVNSDGSQAVAKFKLNETELDEKAVVVLVYNCSCNMNSNQVDSQSNLEDESTDLNNDEEKLFNNPVNTRRMMSDDHSPNNNNTIPNNANKLSGSNVSSAQNDQKFSSDVVASKISNDDFVGNSVPSNAQLENDFLKKCQSLLAAQLNNNANDNNSVNQAVNSALSQNVETNNNVNKLEGNNMQISNGNQPVSEVFSNKNGDANTLNAEENNVSNNVVNVDTNTKNSADTFSVVEITVPNNRNVQNDNDKPENDSANTEPEKNAPENGPANVLNVNNELEEAKKSLISNDFNVHKVDSDLSQKNPEKSNLNLLENSSVRKRRNIYANEKQQSTIYRQKRDVLSDFNETFKNILQAPLRGLELLTSVLDSDPVENRTKREVKINDEPIIYYFDEDTGNLDEGFNPVLNKTKVVLKLREFDLVEDGKRENQDSDKLGSPDKDLKEENEKPSNITNYDKESSLKTDVILPELLKLVRPINVNVYVNLPDKKLAKGKNKNKKN